MMTEHEEILQKLEAISNAWKAQFITPAPQGTWGRRFQKNMVPDLLLKWDIANSIVFLDDIWIAPVDFIQIEQLEQNADYVQMSTIDLPLTDGDLNIMITEEQEKFEISVIERFITVSKNRVKAAHDS